MAGLQYAMQLTQLGVPTNQAGWPHQGGRQRPWCSRPWPRPPLGSLYRLQQGQCLGRGACADFMLEALLAIVKRPQGRSAITGQVQAAHQLAVRILAQRV